MKRKFWAEIHRHWKSEPRFGYFEIYCSKHDVAKVKHICKEYGVEFDVYEFVNQAIVSVKL